MNYENSCDTLISILKKFSFKQQKDNDILEIFFQNDKDENVRIMIGDDYGFEDLILNLEGFSVVLFDNKNKTFSIDILFNKITLFVFNDAILIKNINLNMVHNNTLNLEDIMQVKMYEHFLMLQNKNEDVFLKITFEDEDILMTNSLKNIKKFSVLVIEKSIKNLEIQLDGIFLFVEDTEEKLFIPFENILIFLDFKNQVIFNKFLQIPTKDLNLFDSLLKITIKNGVTYANFKEIAALKSMSNPLPNKEDAKIYYVDFKKHLKDHEDEEK